MDADQAKAVADLHKNCLVTARAGSGKTRVIVAKIAYLIAKCHIPLSAIAVFMFNRTAAAEVNERIAKIMIDGHPIITGPSRCASTFHKFALDIVKSTGARPEIVTDQSAIIAAGFKEAERCLNLRLTPRDRQDYLHLTESFIARVGQQPSLPSPQSMPRAKLYTLFNIVHEYYQQALTWPCTDFNQLLKRATEILAHNRSLRSTYQYLMVDEYQDFSYLFYALLQAIRTNSSSAHLFAVGDDWQAINRFAGSDVDYFVNFAKYFPDDQVNIPLLTNYRSCRKIVENANDFMLKFYDHTAARAIPFNKKSGKVRHVNPAKIHFDSTDLAEDALGDGRYVLAIRRALKLANQSPPKPAVLNSAAKLLKNVVKITIKHCQKTIMILHRHNFTSFDGITLPIFQSALEIFLKKEHIALKHPLRVMTMHKSKGLEADIVILLEADKDQLLGSHPFATVFPFFGDSLETEKADQYRLIYVALTRAKKQLYILSEDQKPCLALDKKHHV